MSDYNVIGFVKLWSGTKAPDNWMFCNGQSLKVNSNTALFSIIGTEFGGDGRFTFDLPKLKAKENAQYIICTTGEFPSRGNG